MRIRSVGHLAERLERLFHWVQLVQLEMMQMDRWDMDTDTAVLHFHSDSAVVALSSALASMAEMAAALVKLLQSVGQK